jgi:imidazolonepropionase-like amidohydrolase
MAVGHGEVATEALLLHEYGLSRQAAVDATSTNAYAYVGRPERPTPGEEADVVFFDRNPIEDVGALAEPRVIIRRGRIIGNDDA